MSSVKHNGKYLGEFSQKPENILGCTRSPGPERVGDKTNNV
jgi:hypothetical protein